MLFTSFSSFDFVDPSAHFPLRGNGLRVALRIGAPKCFGGHVRDAHAAGRDLGATHLVFTHLDEVPQWGKLWDYLFDDALEPLFLSTGASLTGDLEDDVPGALARRTLADT